ncbi:MAG TPA: hypothetical protein PLN56_03980 [Methanoregulaceae archaeon]|nr:MAG: hypothetical protein IPI71_08315 [Methanolinea sp.]HON81254.1 hypothetical protein [Methanoregulaceae archaeon]HPD10140.1 hypothetical protein [Methanoregulaceae archaeon]HRT15146.1 hypothetical protein [Methanoregulaceae archaeon]HRU30737.1 hypothetical protein [Methanoregulaceae archaeon]
MFEFTPGAGQGLVAGKPSEELIGFLFLAGQNPLVAGLASRMGDQELGDGGGRVDGARSG